MLLSTRENIKAITQVSVINNFITQLSSQQPIITPGILIQ